MNKQKTVEKKIKNKIVFTAIVIALVVLIGVIVVVMRPNQYLGVYNLDNQFTITLMENGVCDFSENGKSGYREDGLKCVYSIKNDTIEFNREIIYVHFNYFGMIREEKSSNPSFRCKELSSDMNCEEDILEINEFATIGNSGLIYKDKFYSKLK